MKVWLKIPGTTYEIHWPLCLTALILIIALGILAYNLGH